jgi:hypothetical protein
VFSGIGIAHGYRLQTQMDTHVAYVNHVCDLLASKGGPAHSQNEHGLFWRLNFNFFSGAAKASG